MCIFKNGDTTVSFVHLLQCLSTLKFVKAFYPLSYHQTLIKIMRKQYKLWSCVLKDCQAFLVPWSLYVSFPD